MELYKNTNKILVSNEYEIIKKLGSGSFGEVYLTKIISNSSLVASKIEEKKGKTCKIVDEYKIYKKLEMRGITKGVPKIYSIYETPKFNVLVMELLGESLESRFNTANKKFQLSSVLKLGFDILTIIEKIHNCGFIHRDIKPNNFMFGLDDKIRELYILDFGLSKRYYRNNKHIDYKTNKSLVGTARYTSINIHLGIEPSRRDDLESIGYMLVYFLLGELPWQGLKKQKGVDHLELIAEIKLSTNINKLCEELPNCFEIYLDYCRNLSFEERPDYKYLKNLFIECSEKTGSKMEYEW